MTLKFQWVYAYALQSDDDATLDDLLEAEAKYMEIEKVFARRFGEQHPDTAGLRRELANMRNKPTAYRQMRMRRHVAAFLIQRAFRCGWDWRRIWRERERGTSWRPPDESQDASLVVRCSLGKTFVE